MTRVIHFGVVHRASAAATQDRNANGILVHVDALLRRLAGTPFDVHESFTDSSAPFPQNEADAIHVVHATDCDWADADGERIRLSAEEVQEVADDLADRLPSDLRLVDYWLEDDGDVWGSDEHLHGPFALVSVSGRSL